MVISLNRRSLITGLVSFLAAPAIVRASSLDILRGVPLGGSLAPGLYESDLIWRMREISLGYEIMRRAIEENIYHGDWSSLDEERLDGDGDQVEVADAAYGLGAGEV